MKLIVGLGNPGLKYQTTRHNIGFMIIDSIADKFGASFTKDKKLLCQSVKLNIDGVSCLLLKPQSFMNLSGHVVKKTVDYYKINIDNLLVVHDDMDLPIGVVRFREKGGHGGHNGLKSLITCLNTQDFARLKIGIGRPNIISDVNKSEIISNWVLGSLSASDCEKITKDSLPIADEYTKKFLEDQLN